MRHFTVIAAAALLAASFVLATPAAAQGKDATKTRPSPTLNELDCRTMLRLDGEERAFTLLYLHGFVSGRMNEVALSTDAMADATDRIVEHCIDKPNDKLLTVFEQVRRKAR